MARFILRRLAAAVLVLWAVATIVFMLIRVVGNPAALMLPPDASPAQIEALTAQLGLDVPIYQQYVDYLRGLVTADLGRSLWMREDVTTVLARRVPMTIRLAAITMVLAIVAGVFLGAIAAARPNSLADRMSTGLSFVSISLPEFWFGLILIALVAVQLGWLPTSGSATPAHYVLPVVTLMARPTGRIAQTTKVALAEQLQKHYVETAFGKGLTRRRIVGVHALRNSVLSVITLTADEVANLVAGAVVVETIFAWPGVGLLLIESIRQRDVDVVVGVVLFVAAFVLVMNLVVDLLYGVIDPRVRAR